MTRLRCIVFVVAASLVQIAHADEPHPLALSAQEIKSAGIVISTLAPRALSEEIRAPGEVKANGYDTSLVTPRLDSQVVARHARLGDLVTSGTPLLTLSSVEVATAQGSLIVAEQDWQRIDGLGPRAVSGRRYAEAKIRRDQARATLRAYGLSDAQIDRSLRAGSARADGQYDLAAIGSGRIVSDDFLIGQRVTPGQVLFTIAREGSVWVEARVAPADAARLREGGKAWVVAHDNTLAGTVAQRAHRTDKATRTVPVRIAVANANDLLHAGEMVDARLLVGIGKPALAVPADAIVLLQNQPMLFVRKTDGNFDVVAVATGPTRDGWTPILDGVASGTAYVSKGAFALKARLLRSQLGEH